jgi:hypothetical protein
MWTENEKMIPRFESCTVFKEYSIQLLLSSCGHLRIKLGPVCCFKPVTLATWDTASEGSRFKVSQGKKFSDHIATNDWAGGTSRHKTRS